MSKSGRPDHHLRRACCGSWEDIEPFDNEQDYVSVHVSGGGSLAFMLWRHSTILALVVFFGLAAVVASVSLIIDLDEPKKDRDQATGALKDIFETVYNTELSITIIKILVLVTSFVLMVISALKWKSRDLPIKLLRIAWGIQFTLPFLLQIIPYRSLVDIDAAFTKLGVTKDVVTSLCVSAKASDEQWRCTDLVALEDVDCPENCDDLYDLIITFLRTSVGASYGIRSLITLAPVVLSMLPGGQAGALHAKGVLPFHPLPGVLALIKPILYSAMLYTLASAMYQTVGDAFLALALLSIVASEVVFIVFGRRLAHALNRDAHAKIIKKVGIAQKVCYFFAFVFFLIFFLVNKRLWQLLEIIGDAAEQYQLDVLAIITLILTSIAQSFLTKIVATDAILRLISGETVELDQSAAVIRPVLNDFVSYYEYEASGTARDLTSEHVTFKTDAHASGTGVSTVGSINTVDAVDVGVDSGL